MCCANTLQLQFELVSSTMAVTSDTAPPPSSTTLPTVCILIGMAGSGKSTLLQV